MILFLAVFYTFALVVAFGSVRYDWSESGKLMKVLGVALIATCLAASVLFWIQYVVFMVSV